MAKAAGIALLCGLLVLQSVVAAQAEKRVALVIGNSAYEHAPALVNPARDAQAIAAMFQKSGFDVVNAQYDVGIVQFRRTLRQFEDSATGSDIAVVYFAGHGIEIHGVNYVIPVDAKLASDRDSDDEAIPLDRLVETLDGAKRLRVVILDACRDNPFAPNMKQERTAALRGINPGLGAVEPSSINTLIAYAAKAGSAAEDGDGDHSPFATALLDNLFVPGLDIRLAFGRVRDEVLEKTSNRQEPFVYGSLGGADVSLVPAPTRPPQTAAPAVASHEEENDYSRVEKIGTKNAWEIFLAQYPTGFYAELARENLAALAAAQTAKPAPPPPPSPPLSPPPDQIVWNTVKDSRDPDDLRRFIAQFPNSAERPDAEQRIASLMAEAPKTATANSNDPHELARALQIELKRVGCFNGAVNGEFDDATKTAWHSFTKLAAITMPDDASSDAVKAVRSIDKRVCPLVCPTGEHAEGEQCVGSAPKRVMTEAAPRHLAPAPRAPERAPRASGRCFDYQGKQFCE
jgi:hypothetical protein